MVSGTRCPAWSDQVKKWKESRAAAPKGRCPVGHRGEFLYIHLYVRPSVRTSPPRPLWPKSGSFRPEISPMRPKSTLSDLKSPLLGPKLALSDPKSASLGQKSALFSPKSASQDHKSTLSGLSGFSGLYGLSFLFGLKYALRGFKPALWSLNLDLSGQMDVRKFTPVSYRTSALWGRCPAVTPLLQLITPSRASGTADHVRSLDDLLYISQLELE